MTWRDSLLCSPPSRRVATPVECRCHAGLAGGSSLTKRQRTPERELAVSDGDDLTTADTHATARRHFDAWSEAQHTTVAPQLKSIAEILLAIALQSAGPAPDEVGA